MIVESLQRPPISAKVSAMALGRFPVRSRQADIRRTSGRAHCPESSAADRASLRKASRSLPIAGRTGETPRWMSHGPQPSPPDHATEDRGLRILETLALGRRHSVPLRHWLDVYVVFALPPLLG